MEKERYQLKTSRNQKVFEFTSEGINGVIQKRITYSKMTIPGLYNLALGDIDEISGKVNYDMVTNNGDREKVLATVVASVFSIFSKYPRLAIHITGNTKSRTRLYQMAISIYFDELSKDFEIFGKLNNEVVGFKKGCNYEAFFIMLKEKI